MTDIRLKRRAGNITAADFGDLKVGEVILDVNAGKMYFVESNTTQPSDTKGDQIWQFNASTSISVLFSIASFSDGQGSSQLIGSGQWVAGTSLAFSASYTNGPPASPFPYIVGPTEWTSTDDKLAMDGPNYTAATESSAQNTNYPGSVGGNKSFTLYATDGTTSDTQSTSVTFYNQRCNGLLSKDGSYTSSDINSLSSKVVTSGKNGTFSFSPTAGDYIIIAYRTALGTSSFSVGGFSGGFQTPETVSHTNSAGFTENYYVYQSQNHSLADPTEVIVS